MFLTSIFQPTCLRFGPQVEAQKTGTLLKISVGASKGFQERPKSVPRGPKSVPRAAQERHKGGRDPSKSVQNASSDAQDSSKSAQKQPRAQNQGTAL